MRFWLLVFLLVCFDTGFAQLPANLSFDSPGTYNDVAPWVRTSFRGKKYRITLDSTTVYEGKYSLRFAYDTLNKKSSDGGLFISVPVDVVGKRLTVSGYAKTSNPSDTVIGIISFVVSQDKGEKKLAVKGSAIKAIKGWQPYRFSIDLDTMQQPLHHLRINCVAETKDTLWVDAFRIEVDGKNLYDLTPLSSPIGETAKPLMAQQATNLKMLCYVWGFLKYYHPAVAGGKYNWDAELFRMLPQLKAAASNAELSERLKAWIDSLGPLPECKRCDDGPAKGSVTYNIDLRWMEADAFSQELQSTLKNVLANRHQGEGFYVKYEPVKTILPLNENEYNWRSMTYPSEAFRLQFLFRYWNTIQYFYPYKNIIDKNWYAVLEEFVPQFAEAKDSVQYHIAMNKLVNSVNDSHAGAYDPVLTKEFGDLYLPVQITMAEGKAVVTGAFNDSLANRSGLQRGDVIAKVAGVAIDTIIQQRSPLVGGSNRGRTLLYLLGYNFITGGKDSMASITYMRNGKEATASVRRYRFSDLHYTYKPDTTKWKILSGNIGYVHMGNVKPQDVDSAMLALRNTKAIVFDLRHYPKGTYGLLADYLKKKETVFAKITYPDFNYPGNFLWEKYDIKCGPGSDSKALFLYEGKTVLLVNELTQSQAEWTVMALQTVPGAVTVGSQTSGADGNAPTLNLGGGYSTFMTGLGVFYPDGGQTQRVGVRIDKVVKPTIKGVTERRDEQLEAAIAAANE